MPRVMPKPKKRQKRQTWQDDDIVVAWQAFCTDAHVVRRGTELRGSHEAVRACPEYFVLASTPETERPSPWSSIAAETERVETERALERAALAPPPLRAEDAVRARETFTEVSTGRTINKGTLLAIDDTLVKRFPEHFEHLPVPLKRGGN
jgi:hypothetical protein